MAAMHFGESFRLLSLDGDARRVIRPTTVRGVSAVTAVQVA
jgi:hypothetical protein